ncbi:glycosyl hydrolase family 18 protein [Priestia abyssalis]|uniref:glycosyl hydrolase family 18 protein n=1 Tax=Priestia abyssalis TaxID=1221450 RepID=UPI000995A797|nr:LysM peptidoglycan-binding domain-containing protein [Priestia abyssalis]
MPVHVVQGGESLWRIANVYGVSMETIVEVNGLPASDSIVPGLALYIPQRDVPIRHYLIQSGDTLWKLAQRFNTSPQIIFIANPGINLNRLNVGQRIRIPSPTKLNMTTLGFIVPYAPDSFLPMFADIAEYLTYAAIVAYSFTPEGNIRRELDDTAVLARSKQLNVSPLLCIRNYTNEQFNAELAGQVLGNPSLRSNLVRSMVAAVKGKGYDGVSIDFEFVPPARRNDFNTFLRDLKQALGELVLHVNVHSKTQDIPTNPIIGAYDYQIIGQIADIVAVMTMDYGYPSGPPNPVSPANWMEQVIRYAVSLVNPKKLQVAFPLYGYDWILPFKPENPTKALTVLGAQNQAIANGSPIQYNSTFEAPFYFYWKGTEQHIVWFEDIRSYMAKYELIDLYQLLGVTFWQLRFPFPQNWAYMERNFTIARK